MICHVIWLLSKDNTGPFLGKHFLWRLMQTQSTLFNLAKYDLTNLFCFLGKPIVYYILEFKVRQLRTNDVNEKKARKKRNLEHRQEQIMKWWAWSVPRRYWCHDSAITGSFGVDTSYAKIPHRHLTSQMGCNRF